MGAPDSQNGSYTAEIADQFSDWERSKSPYLWRRRVEIALPHLPRRGRVLDVGCGDRTAIEHFERQRPEPAYFGADLRDLSAGPGLVRSDCRSLPFADGSFDCVLMLAVIEHVPDQRAAIDEARRVLRPDGLLLVTTPNPLYAMPGAIAGRLGLKYREGFDNSISLDRLAALTAAAGLEVVEARGFLLLPFANPLAALDRALGRAPLARRLLLNQFLKARRP
jgi:SAM-dependent methyltransferase